MASERRPRPKLIERLQARRARYRERDAVLRIAFGLAGALVMPAGLVMVVTPGRAFGLIAVGLAMLSVERVWADRLGKSLKQAANAKENAAHTSHVRVPARLRWAIPLLPDG